MKFYEIVEHVLTLLQREGRVSYRALKREFDLDDEYLEDLKAEIIEAKQLAVDESGKVLVWTGGTTKEEPEKRRSGDSGKEQTSSDTRRQPLDSSRPEAERRQLTVMFCDLVGSTVLSEQLDPEDLREVVRAYQETCTSVIRRYDGHIAQHLGDGVLVYFGYPVAHEDDAVRAVRAGLEIVGAIHALPLQHVQLQHPLQVRIGIHTGVVVIGEIGGSEKREILALGDTPNIAARLQGLAEPDTVVVSGATHRLSEGFFACRSFGPSALKGISAPVDVYHVLEESGLQSRFEVTVGAGLTPLVGREEELGILQRRWAQAKEGAGQAVLLSGEAGIGKSRLVQALKEQVTAEGITRIEFRCSPYHHNSAFYPIIEHLQRLLQFGSHDTPQTKLVKLQQALMAYRFPQVDTFPLLAALLSLPHPEGVPPLTLSLQKQKQKTQEALVAWIVGEAEKAAVYCAWEDLHWADPSTLEVLTLFLEQIPTTRVFTILTFRPDFTPLWGSRSYLTPLTLSRLGRPHVETMVEKVIRGRTLPAEVLQQIVAKTDGVPLFVEELTKMVVESGLLREEGNHYELTGPLPPLAIPSTLQDSLMARLDRLAPVRELAQVGAALGREFSYDLIHAVSSVDEALLQQGLRQLVEAELLYQRGLPPQATYLFKHALVQDTAYQSLLKSKRQQLHQQIGQVLEQQFSETAETQPELLAHHYTEAGLKDQAIPYWQQAGQRASKRSANIEAISHLLKGLELLKTLPDTPERTQQELTLQLALGSPLMATKGYAVPEVERVYLRARELCQQVGESPQLFPVLSGLWLLYLARAELQTARELAAQLLSLAQRVQDPACLVEAHRALGVTLWHLGEIVSAQQHLEQGIALYNSQQQRSLTFLQVIDPWMFCRAFAALALWLRGYPDQALEATRAALTLARELSHPYSLGYALDGAVWLHRFRREPHAVQERAAVLGEFSREQGFTLLLAEGTMFQGWALTEQGHEEEGMARIRQGLAALRATGLEVVRPYFLALLAEGYGKGEQAEEGLTVLDEALVAVHRNAGCFYEAELYRLKGGLMLQSKASLKQVQGKSKTSQDKSRVQNPESEAEECFWKAIEIARGQQAKSLELRAVMSLSRLWQQQDKKKEAQQMLADIYSWFTEGFDTKDLQEAKALLQELA